MDQPPELPPAGAAQYYEECLERLRDLADWFFHGWHSYLEPHVWRDL
ncbi:hypothetical protein [Paractinoplanes durhamensis]|uniref:Uncharacterized protein n=1 Tax=Paractinoplanes durhamensis TaxID=113563 RepID=A0ABQ3ZDI0_9ACTN|nr:hypothetical protein [Actinoplanes durhamensis]GIE07845.1 hypothetical protein Adu01nite_91950 [Actinoplanes durhamensis]